MSDALAIIRGRSFRRSSTLPATPSNFRSRLRCAKVAVCATNSSRTLGKLRASTRTSEAEGSNGAALQSSQPGSRKPFSYRLAIRGRRSPLRRIERAVASRRIVNVFTPYQPLNFSLSASPQLMCTSLAAAGTRRIDCPKQILRHRRRRPTDDLTEIPTNSRLPSAGCGG